MRLKEISALYVLVGALAVGTSAQAQPVSLEEEQRANDEACELNAKLEAAPPLQAVLSFTKTQEKAANANTYYQCFDVFSLIRDQGPNDQTQTIGRQLWQTGHKMHLMDVFATNISTSSVVMAGEMGFIHETEFYEYFWMKRRAQENAHNWLVSLIEKKDASTIINVTAYCFSAASNMKTHIDSLKNSDEMIALANSYQETQNVRDQHLVVFEALNTSIFGYSPPTNAQVSENFEVGAQLAPAVFAAGLAWKNAFLVWIQAPKSVGHLPTRGLAACVINRA